MDEQPLSPVPAHHNVPVPFAADIPGGVFPGKAVLVKGVVLDSQQETRFNIDLCCGKLVQGEHQDDKALHFNPRFDRGGLFSRPDRAIVLNALVNNKWGMEQRCENELEPGRPFSCRILILRDYFKISLNGKHLSDFIHRCPLETIRCIFVAGCVSIDLIEYQGTRPIGTPSACPVPNSPQCADLDEPIEVLRPDVPFIFRLPEGGFLPPRELLLILTPLLNALHFAVNFQCGDEHLFHLRVDFPDRNGPVGERGAIVRNSTSGGEWQREERQMGRFPFTPGITSDLKIVTMGGGLKVFVDGSHLCEFSYRPKGPLATEVDKVTVQGDVGLQKVALRKRQQ